MYVDLEDTRSDPEKEKAANVSHTTAWRVRKRPEGREYINDSTGGELIAQKPNLFRVLLTAALAGDIAAMRLILQVTDDIGTGSVNISTTVNVENEIKQKSDDELAGEIAEDEDMLRRAEVLAGVDE
jgi:hypothetical protein